MKKLILFLSAIALVFAEASLVHANVAFSNSTDAGWQIRSFTGSQSTTDTSSFTFEIDFQYPAEATTPYTNEQVFWIDLFSDSSVQTSGNSSIPPSPYLTNALRLEVRPISDSTGESISWNLFRATPTTEISLWSSGTNFGYDHAWHRLKIDVQSTAVSIYFDDDLHLTQSFSALDGEFALSGEYFSVIEGHNGVTDVNKKIHFDNIIINGVAVDDFEGGTTFGDGWLVSGSAVTWEVDTSEDSTILVPVELSTFELD